MWRVPRSVGAARRPDRPRRGLDPGRGLSATLSPQEPRSLPGLFHVHGTARSAYRPGTSPSKCARAAKGCAHARNRDRRSPVGRRGQRQGDRPPREPGRLRREVQRRQQRRPHGRHRRREVRPPPAAERHPHARAARRSSATASSSTSASSSRSSTGSRPGASTRRELLLSANAHLIAEYHRTLDKVAERFLGSRRIGTTGRGIGPAYADKMNRIGVRVQDIFDEKILRQKVEGSLELKNQMLAKIYNRRAIEVDQIMDELLQHRDRIAPMVADTSLVLNQALDRGETVLLEAGQATLLDVDHGTYPFVTSSSATSGGACTGFRDRADADRPGDRDRQGLRHTGRRGTVPDRAVRRQRRVPAQDRVGVRHDDRPAAPLRLVRRGRGPVRRAGQRRHRLRADQARRADRAGDGAGLRGLRRRRRTPRRDAGQPDGLPPRQADLRGAARLVGGHLRGAHARRPAAERPGLRQGGRGDVGRPDLRDRRRARADTRPPWCTTCSRSRRSG